MDTVTTAIVVVLVCCVIAIRIFVKDNKHDLEIQAWNFRITIKKHE